MSARHRSWALRHRDSLIIAALVVALGMLGGYNLWAARVSNRNAATAVKANRTAATVGKLTKGQCGQTRFLYGFLNALAEDSSPSFGSPPDGPIVPGARARLIGQLYAAERASLPRLAQQGCRVTAPPAVPG